MNAAKTANAGRSGEPRIQYAALPWRGRERPEIMLVSSRDTHRWIIPKGWPMKGRRPYAAAAREALEEAGLIGKISKEAVGTYHYLKRTSAGGVLPCKVTVFPLGVTHQRKNWPERKHRTTRWFSVEDATLAVAEPELKELIAGFGRMLERRGSGIQPSARERRESAYHPTLSTDQLARTKSDRNMRR